MLFLEVKIGFLSQTMSGTCSRVPLWRHWLCTCRERDRFSHVFLRFISCIFLILKLCPDTTENTQYRRPREQQVLFGFKWVQRTRTDGPHSRVQRIGEPHDRKFFFYDHSRSVGLELNSRGAYKRTEKWTFRCFSPRELLGLVGCPWLRVVLC